MCVHLSADWFAANRNAQRNIDTRHAGLSRFGDGGCIRGRESLLLVTFCEQHIVFSWRGCANRILLTRVSVWISRENDERRVSSRTFGMFRNSFANRHQHRFVCRKLSEKKTDGDSESIYQHTIVHCTTNRTCLNARCIQVLHHVLVYTSTRWSEMHLRAHGIELPKQMQWDKDTRVTLAVEPIGNYGVMSLVLSYIPLYWVESAIKAFMLCDYPERGSINNYNQPYATTGWYHVSKFH